MSLLEIKNLSVAFGKTSNTVLAVDDISFRLNKNKILAVVGESGSGKSVTALSILKLLNYPYAHHPRGEIFFEGKNILNFSERDLLKIRGRDIGMIFQEPMTALNPLYTVGKQIDEALLTHQFLSHAQAKSATLELLRLVGFDNLEERYQAYPHQLSGGQRQRIIIAIAIANKPKLLIADEPTTALDVTVQAQILSLLQSLKKQFEMSILFITHNLGIVKKIADDVIVMERGRIVEENSCSNIFSKPKHIYTQKLLAAEPDGSPGKASHQQVLNAQDLFVSFPLKKSFFGKVQKELKAVDRVSFSLNEGETIGIVGESGCGKTTLAMSLLKLQKSQGKIVFLGQDISHLKKSQSRDLRQNLQVVFQDPFGSLNPRLSVSQIIEEGLSVHQKKLSSVERFEKITQILKDVELDIRFKDRYPHELSGGQRQRVAIARALILDPKVIVLDEPTSALDRSIQKNVIDLLRRLQKEKKLSYLFISHDLKVVRAMSHRILVMKNGCVVEQGTSDDIFEKPQNDYTKKLIKASFDFEL